MKKILFLPFLQMTTGHHTVADSLIRSLEKRVPEIICKKMDFLSYVDERLEKIFTRTYLTWIDHAPQTYEFIYRHFVYPSKSRKHLKWYEYFFLEKMEEMLSQEQADLIVCTQGFPSYLISRLKEQGKVNTPVVNVYTDFFINKLWGLHGIDYHFVPDLPLKHELVYTHGIPGKKVFITGIPVDECFIPLKNEHKTSPPYTLLICGGNSGLGDIHSFLKGIKPSQDFNYLVLCGKNQKLYGEILSWKRQDIQPLPYISSRQEMDTLYNQVDAIITKPGGVTISEALNKKLPVFVHSALPGQELVNLKYLTSHGFVYVLKPDQPIPEQLSNMLSDNLKFNTWRKKVEDYHKRLEVKAWQKILDFIQLTDYNEKEYTFAEKGERV